MSHSVKQFVSAVALLSAAFISGCDSVDPPAFRMNMVEAVSYETSSDYQQEIADVLGALFGTPDEPFALPETGLDQSKLTQSAGAAWSDEEGYNYGLYRKHCVHCHGVTGDGRGATAQFLNPYPRDYRPGVYKFKSTFNAAKPTDDDLHRVLINGIPGTAMPSFSLLPGSEVESLVEYVKYLSYRGEMETKLIQYVFNELGEDEEEADDGTITVTRIPLDPANDPDQRDAVMELLAEVVEEWDAANGMIVAPEEESIPADDRSPEEILASVEKGRELFYGKAANCYTCHGPTGLGDGQVDDYDNWQKAHKKFLDETVKMADKDELDDYEYALLGQREEVSESLYPLRNAIPRNLRQGVYRGGNRRLDIFRRIYAGIAGSPMPAGGPTGPGAKSALSEAEMWSIVDYVLSLPYEPASQPQKVTPKYTEAIAR
ncbi:MAG: cytochrome c [Planctomycetota bacterium]